MNPMEPRAILFAVSLIVLALPPAARAQSASACLACHTEASVLKASAHKKLACVACHDGFDPANVPHRAKIEPIICSSCHQDAGAKHPFHPRIAQALKAGKQPAIACKDCHGTHEVALVRAPGSKFVGAKTLDSCGACHPDVAAQFSKCSHGKALAAGQKGAPDCVSCHKSPIAGTADKLARKQTQEKLCLACHRDNPDVTDRIAPTSAFIASYEKSVHGAALLKGNAAAANCVDCHGSHVMQKGSAPDAKSNKLHIRKTCAKCHEKIAKDYSSSVHGETLAAGNLDAPVCTDCHGEHQIFKHDDPRSRVAAQNLSAQTCSPCHSSLSLSSKYGLASDRFKTFTDSYHGLAIKGGSLAVANCASCHGFHDVRRSSDPASMINKANIAATCGKCHPGANQRFSVGSMHVSLTSRVEQPILYWLALGYIALIVLVIGGMFAHNALDFIKKSKHKLQLRSGQLQEEHAEYAVYLRMTLNERWQHAALMVSFIILVLTGFMLRFPDAWCFRWIRLLGDGAFDLRGLVHRIAAVVMVMVGVYHACYCAFTERGRGLVRDLFPDL
ncbi:MAG: cytochrome c3 family protein, partial [Elusimicrobiota bacterium]